MSVISGIRGSRADRSASPGRSKYPLALAGSGADEGVGLKSLSHPIDASPSLRARAEVVRCAENEGGTPLTGRRRGDAPTGSAFQGLQVWINGAVGYVLQRLVRRVYRNKIGDWCAELVVDDQTLEEVFDHHPTATMMHALKAGGTEISEDILSQGAEGEDFSGRGEGD